MRQEPTAIDRLKQYTDLAQNMLAEAAEYSTGSRWNHQASTIDTARRPEPATMIEGALVWATLAAAWGPLAAEEAAAIRLEEGWAPPPRAKAAEPWSGASKG